MNKSERNARKSVPVFSTKTTSISHVNDASGPDLVLRAEMPEQQLRKAIRVKLTDTVQTVLSHLCEKFSLQQASIRHFGLFRPASTSDQGCSNDGEWLAEWKSLESCAAMNPWKNHDLILICRHSSHHPVAMNPCSVTELEKVVAHQRSSSMHSKPPAPISSRHVSSPEISISSHCAHLSSHYPSSVFINLEQDDADELAASSVELKSNVTLPIQTDSNASVNFSTPSLGKTAVKIASSLHVDDESGNLRSSRRLFRLKPALPVFSVPLQRVKTDARTRTPEIVETILTYLETHEIQTEGLFRLSGASSELQRLRELFSTGSGVVDLEALRPDPHAVAGLLKCFLRELPEPLLTFSLFDCWMAIAAALSQLNSSCNVDATMNQPTLHATHVIDNECRVLRDLKDVCGCLPDAHYRLLARLSLFFHTMIRRFGTENKMTLKSIATVIGPNILRSSAPSPLEIAHAANAVNIVTLELIRNAPTLFPDEFSHSLGANINCSPLIQPSSPSEQQQPTIRLVRAIFSYSPQYRGHVLVEDGLKELEFHRGDYLAIKSIAPFGDADEHGWWMGCVIGKLQSSLASSNQYLGILPCNYVEIVWRRSQSQIDASTDLLHSPIMSADNSNNSETPLYHPLNEFSRRSLPPLNSSTDDFVFSNHAKTSSAPASLRVTFSLNDASSPLNDASSFNSTSSRNVDFINSGSNKNELSPRIENEMFVLLERNRQVILLNGSLRTRNDALTTENEALKFQIKKVERQIESLELAKFPLDSETAQSISTSSETPEVMADVACEYRTALDAFAGDSSPNHARRSISLSALSNNSSVFTTTSFTSSESTNSVERHPSLSLSMNTRHDATTLDSSVRLQPPFLMPKISLELPKSLLPPSSFPSRFFTIPPPPVNSPPQSKSATLNFQTHRPPPLDLCVHTFPTIGGTLSRSHARKTLDDASSHYPFGDGQTPSAQIVETSCNPLPSTRIRSPQPPPPPADFIRTPVSPIPVPDDIETSTSRMNHLKLTPPQFYAPSPQFQLLPPQFNVPPPPTTKPPFAA